MSEGVLRDKDGNLIEMICTVCDTQMEITSGLRADCIVCKDQSFPHLHMRCKVCFPGYYSVLKLQTKAQA